MSLLANDRQPPLAVATRVALATLDELARLGHENSDVPRLWLDATLRWAHGEAPTHEVIPYSRQLRALSQEEGLDRVLQWMIGICYELREVRARDTWHIQRADHVVVQCTNTLRFVTGEPPDPVRVRVAHWVLQFRREEYDRVCAFCLHVNRRDYVLCEGCTRTHRESTARRRATAGLREGRKVVSP